MCRKGDLDRLTAHVPVEVQDAAKVALREAKKLWASGKGLMRTEFYTINNCYPCKSYQSFPGGLFIGPKTIIPPIPV